MAIYLGANAAPHSCVRACVVGDSVNTYTRVRVQKPCALKDGADADAGPKQTNTNQTKKNMAAGQAANDKLDIDMRTRSQSCGLFAYGRAFICEDIVLLCVRNSRREFCTDRLAWGQN